MVTKVTGSFPATNGTRPRDTAEWNNGTSSLHLSWCWFTHGVETTPLRAALLLSTRPSSPTTQGRSQLPRNTRGREFFGGAPWKKPKNRSRSSRACWPSGCAGHCATLSYCSPGSIAAVIISVPSTSRPRGLWTSLRQVVHQSDGTARPLASQTHQGAFFLRVWPTFFVLAWSSFWSCQVKTASRTRFSHSLRPCGLWASMRHRVYSGFQSTQRWSHKLAPRSNSFVLGSCPCHSILRFCGRCLHRGARSGTQGKSELFTVTRLARTNYFFVFRAIQTRVLRRSQYKKPMRRVIGLTFRVQKPDSAVLRDFCLLPRRLAHACTGSADGLWCS